MTLTGMNASFSLFLLPALLLSGCTTNDFKVVDALHAGMTRSQGNSTVESFGFKRSMTLSRPAAGWSTDDSPRNSINLNARASYQEQQFGKRIAKVDYYPVGHGLFGFGLLFLFYDTEGHLAQFYRKQIN